MTKIMLRWGVNSRVAPCFNFGRGKQLVRWIWFCHVRGRMCWAVFLLSQNGNLPYGTILGTPAEVCYFGSNVTNLEKCVKEFLDFVELRIIC